MIVVAGLKYSAKVLLPALVAVFLTVLSAPTVLWLERRRVPAWLAVIIVMIGLIALIVAFGTLLGTSVGGFNEAMPGYQRAITSMFASALQSLEALPFDLGASATADAFDPQVAMRLTASVFGTVLAALQNAALVVIIVVFMLLEVAGFPRKLRAAMDDPNADLGQWGAAIKQVQRYLVIKTAISLTTGVLIAIWLAILGVDFPILWGLVAFMLNYIPSIGSVIAAVPAVLVAAVQPDLPLAAVLGVALGYLAVNVLLGNILEPQLMGRRFGLSPLVVFLSLVFWGFVWGPFGMLLSVPLTMMVRIVLAQREDTRWIAILLASSPDEEEPRASSAEARGARPEENAERAPDPVGSDTDQNDVRD